MVAPPWSPAQERPRFEAELRAALARAGAGLMLYAVVAEPATVIVLRLVLLCGNTVPLTDPF